jgi:acyl-coenzyme A thioesterase PaaI-like protein
MSDYQSLTPEVEERVCESFARQKLINTLNGKIAHISPGELHISAPFDERFTQQDGFLHACIVTTLMDSAPTGTPPAGRGAVMLPTHLCPQTHAC